MASAKVLLIVVVLQLVLLQVWMAEGSGNARKLPPFNGSIFGKRAGKLSPYQNLMLSLSKNFPLLVEFFKCELPHLFFWQIQAIQPPMQRVQALGSQSAKWQWKHAVATIISSWNPIEDELIDRK